MNQPREFSTLPPLTHPHLDGCRTGDSQEIAWTLQNTPMSPLWSSETTTGPRPGAAALPPAPVALGSCSRSPGLHRGSCHGYLTGLSPRCCCFSSPTPFTPETPDPSLGLCMSHRCHRHRLTLKLALGFLTPANMASACWCPPVQLLGSQHPQFGASSHFCPKVSLKINTVKFFLHVMLSSLMEITHGTGVRIE